MNELKLEKNKHNAYILELLKAHKEAISKNMERIAELKKDNEKMKEYLSDIDFGLEQLDDLISELIE